MLYIVELESISTRYTGQWASHIPIMLMANGIEAMRILGPIDIPPAVTPGAFLNFGGTNVYKSTQLTEISRMFCNGMVKVGDQFLFTDAWNPAIINLKYMSELLKIPVKIHALWHAGHYDKNDFLGRLEGNTRWVTTFEQSLYYAIDHNYFATDFHIDMFWDSLLYGSGATLEYAKKTKKIVKTGWPFENLRRNVINDIENVVKRNLIVFPHRISEEKQPEIFRDLAKELPQYEFVVCQDKQLTKKEYHKIIGETKVLFSANLQETLGITTCGEGPIAGAIPFAPDRLSYTEIFKDHQKFLYPSNWATNWESYIAHREIIKHMIKERIIYYENFLPYVTDYMNTSYKDFFHADTLWENLK
jgi:hypothetical protein